MAALWAHRLGRAPGSLHSCKGLSKFVVLRQGEESLATFDQDAQPVFSASGWQAGGPRAWWCRRCRVRAQEGLAPHTLSSFLSGILSTGATFAEFPGPSWGGIVSHVFMERPVCSSELRAPPYPVTYVRQPGPDLLQWAIGKAPSLCPQLHTLLLDLNSTVL